jgi:hypothetical protein
MAVPNEDQANAELEVIEECGQGVVDILLSNKALEHVPVVKMLVVAIKAVTSIKDVILLQKIVGFLTALPDVPITHRIEMVRKLESDPGYNRKVGQHLIELLERVDSYRKPAMIGRVFAAYAMGRIDLMSLQRLNTAIERLPTHEIDTVRRIADAVASNRAALGTIDSESTYAVINAGLAYIEGGFGGGGLETTKTCANFLELQLDFKRAD